MEKLYCFVDESGQDVNSSYFIVVAVCCVEPEVVRSFLLQIEEKTVVGIRKWRNSSPERRMEYLEIITTAVNSAVFVYYGKYKKPLPYFFPYVDVIEYAIRTSVQFNSRAIVYIDGIDRKKASELTNVL